MNDYPGLTTTDEIASTQVKSVQTPYYPGYNLRTFRKVTTERSPDLHDSTLAAEIELLGDILAAAAHAPGHLTDDQVDTALDVHPRPPQTGPPTASKPSASPTPIDRRAVPGTASGRSPGQSASGYGCTTGAPSRPGAPAPHPDTVNVSTSRETLRSLAMRTHTVPTRLITGAYILHTGLEKWHGSPQQATGLHQMASAAFPVLKDVPPPRFLRLLSMGEMTVGTALLVPAVPPLVAGAALTGFSGALVTLYLRTPAMRKPGSIWPTQQGIAVSKDTWMLAIGLGLIIDAITSNPRR